MNGPTTRTVKLCSGCRERLNDTYPYGTVYCMVQQGAVRVECKEVVDADERHSSHSVPEDPIPYA